MKYHYAAKVESVELAGIWDLLEFDSEVDPSTMTYDEMEDFVADRQDFKDLETELQNSIKEDLIKDFDEDDEEDEDFESNMEDLEMNCMVVITDIEVTPIVE